LKRYQQRKGAMMQSTLFSNRRRDILLLVFSGIGFTVFAGRGIYLTIKGFSSGIISTTGLSASLFAAFGMFFCAALLLPVIIYCILRLMGKEIRSADVRPIKLWHVMVFLVAWVFSIVLATIFSGSQNYWGLLALPFFILGVALPVTGIIWVAIGGLPAGSWRRLWAAFTIGMTGSTLGALFLEYSVIGLAVVAAVAVSAFHPGGLATLQHAWNQVVDAGDMQNLLTTLAPYLANPLVLLLALLFGSILAPLIEEALKPAAVWLLGKRLHSPAEGFALGALCGAGFALLEGTLAISGNFQMLGFALAARSTSSLMHITASGVVGWGIASAQLEKRYGRLAGAYLVSVSMHGLWNGSLILAVFGGLRLVLPGASSHLLDMLLIMTGVGMLILMLPAILILLPVINHRLRIRIPITSTSVHNDIIAPPQS
jgi:hypothetical protein